MGPPSLDRHNGWEQWDRSTSHDGTRDYMNNEVAALRSLFWSTLT